jgi:hypothetical protein
MLSEFARYPDWKFPLKSHKSLLTMSISDILHQLSENLSSYDITLYPPATDSDLIDFKGKLKWTLPDDMKTLYRFCNGFESAEDLFRIIPLEEITDRLSEYKLNCFHFAEYMIYCDMWQIEINPSNANEYWISNQGKTFRLLTQSLAEFLGRFLAKGVFEDGGLYTWHDEVDIQKKP